MSDDEAREIVAVNLRRLRERDALSLAEVGRRASTSAGAIRNIENGERMPGVGLLTRLAEVFHVQLEEFLKRPRRSA